MEDFLALVDPSLHSLSGSVFYSGRAAFEAASKLYILGLNPGGCAVRQANETIGLNIEQWRHRDAYWSEYLNERWNNHVAGTYKMQPRVLYLLKQLGFHPHTVPASNVIFVRSTRQADLNYDIGECLEAVWKIGFEGFRGAGGYDSSFGCGQSRVVAGWPKSRRRPSATRLT